MDPLLVAAVACLGLLAPTSANVAANASKSAVYSVYADVVLECPLLKSPVMWITPAGKVVVGNSTLAASQVSNCSLGNATSPAATAVTLITHDDAVGHCSVFENGTLLIERFGWADRGLYECFPAHDEGRDGVESALVEAAIDDDYRWYIYHFSLVYGFATAGGFLLLTLFFKLVYFLLQTYGCCLFCCCCEDRLPPKARKIKRALDSIEAYRQQQLTGLRENYNQQTDWIRQNCASQMERVRENYNSQAQNIRDIRQYGTSQLQSVRDQYYEQIQRIRDYSSSQLDRVHENYIFQRQRLRKFSAQNYLKMRETGKYTQRTLNKVVGSLPPLYLDLSTCRQGAEASVGHRGSAYWNADAFHVAELEPFEVEVCDGDGGSGSLYFTPKETPVHEAGSREIKTASLKGSSPVKDPGAAYRSVYRMHKKSKSFSHFLPNRWFSGVGDDIAPEDDDDAEPFHQRVTVIIEHETSSRDYLDVDMADGGKAIPENEMPGEMSQSASVEKELSGSAGDILLSEKALELVAPLAQAEGEEEEE